MNLRLVNLQPEFIQHRWVYSGRPGYKYPGKDWGEPEWHEELHEVWTLDEAHSIQFLCPVCFLKNGGPVGTHLVLVSFAGRNIPPNCGSRNEQGQPSRWHVSGGWFHNLTLSPSIDLTRGGKDPGEWHGFINNGVVT